MTDRIKNTLRSPLLHFVGIGALIYAAYGWTADESSAEAGDSRAVHVSAGEVDWLAESFAKRWNRGPTPAEAQGLLDAYVRETILYREALAMGLDEDDTIIRRRLVQKLEFLFQDLSDAAVPTNEEQRAYFAEHAERYQLPEVVTFAHVFVDPDKRGDSTLDDAEAILSELRARDDPVDGASELGDRFMLQSYYPERTRQEVAKLFGEGFTDTLMTLDKGAWHGPVLSGYGVHLVYLLELTEVQPLDFEEVQPRVLEDLQAEKRERFNEDFYAELRARYEIIVDPPIESTGGPRGDPQPLTD